MTHDRRGFGYLSQHCSKDGNALVIVATFGAVARAKVDGLTVEGD